MVIDFHSHILPGLDNGSTDMGMSIAMLKEMYSQGIDVVVATPHFNPETQDIDEFLEKRNSAYFEMQFIIEKEAITVPKIILGAEVAYMPGIENYEELESLFISDTHMILLEMPNGIWDQKVFNSLVELCFVKKIDLALAHYDRYTNNHGKEIANKVQKLPLWIQADCGSFSKFMTGKKVMASLRDGEIHLIGTNAHNMKESPVNMFKFRRLVESKLGPATLEKIDEETKKVLNL